jgi:hypothetical protein
MEVQEIIKTVENLQANVSTGIIVIFYYLVVYWPRIKDGLGLTRNRKVDLDRVEKNFQLLKLRIEIEKLKKDSGLDSELLERLEQEMQSRLGRQKDKPFTNAQKFVAIPLIILIILQSLLELQALTPASPNSATDILTGTVFILTVIIVGFWGIPVLQKLQSRGLRKTGFIMFWTFGFYIPAYFLIFIFVKLSSGTEQLPGSTLGAIFLSALAASVILGIIGRLPFMRVAPENPPD